MRTALVEQSATATVGTAAATFTKPKFFIALLFGPQTSQIQNNLHRATHSRQRAVFKLAVEIHTSRKEVGARQTHIRQTRAVRTPTNRAHQRFNTCLAHSSQRTRDHLGMRLDHLAHIAVAVHQLQFDGTLIIVSHDRDFLQGLTNKVYEFRKPNIKEYIGDIYDFLEEKKMKELDDLNKKMKSMPTENNISQGKLDYETKKQNDREIKRIEREIKKLEEQIESLENEIAEMDKVMSSPTDYPDINIDNAWYSSYGEKKERLQDLMNQWEEKAMSI